MSEVFVVYRHVLGACDALFVYAICTSNYGAKSVRRRVAGFKKGCQYFDVDPASSPYACQLRILKVQADRLYSLGVLSRVGHGSKEIIA